MPKPLPGGVLCITSDECGLSHVEQARRLCAAGARLVQLRTKRPCTARFKETVRAFSEICAEHGVYSILNDHVDHAAEGGVDAVHLGQEDTTWTEARRRLPGHIAIGGTVNNCRHAAEALACGVLAYAGVGPWRFTRTKRRLSPVLGPGGVAPLLRYLGPLPCFVIGGILPSDLPRLHALGARGAAVCSPLYHDLRIEAHFQNYASQWPIQ